MNAAVLFARFARGAATGVMAWIMAEVPRESLTAIFTGFSMPIALGIKERNVIIKREPTTTLTIHPNGPNSAESTIPIVVARTTLAMVSMNVVTLTSFVF